MTESTGLPGQHKGASLKRRLLQAVEESDQELSDIMQTFLDKPHRSEKDKLDLLKAIIEVVNDVLSAGDWESSLFLRNQAKSIRVMKERAEAELKTRLGKAEKSKVKVPEIADDEVAVFVSLFQSEGHNMEKWAVQLRSLGRYVIGRPVYEREEDVQARIRLRGSKDSSAYVVVAVKQTDVKKDPFSPVLKDQFDHPLIQLKDTAVQKGKIIAFVHQKIRYVFQNGQLIKVE